VGSRHETRRYPATEPGSMSCRPPYQNADVVAPKRVYVRYPLCILIIVESIGTPTSSDLMSMLYNGRMLPVVQAGAPPPFLAGSSLVQLTLPG
jgi:hypothetical protein